MIIAVAQIVMYMCSSYNVHHFDLDNKSLM